MCLEKITCSKLKKKKGIGYKVMIAYQRPGESVMSYIHEIIPTPESWRVFEWKRAFPKKVHSPKYITGFHIFPKLKDAYEWQKRAYLRWHFPLPIVKVEYRKARIRGRQRGLSVIVADEMRILEEVK